MPKVIADISMSLDGFVTGDGADEQHGLGDAPELHTWVIQQDAVDTEILEQSTAQSGAVVMGRRLFDVVNGPDGWNDEMGYGADQTGTPPFIVVTHSPPQEVRLERELGMRVTFVSDLVTAIDQARSAATHGDVVIMGGGDVIGQALEQGLVDELRLHLAPMLLRWRHTALQTRDAPDVPPTRSSPIAQRRTPHLRTRADVDRDVKVRRRSTRAPEARTVTSNRAQLPIGNAPSACPQARQIRRSGRPCSRPNGAHNTRRAMTPDLGVRYSPGGRYGQVAILQVFIARSS